MFERHIFKFYKFNILSLIKIPSACPASLPDWCVKRVSVQKVLASPPRGNCCLRVLSAVGICGGALQKKKKKRQQIPKRVAGFMYAAQPTDTEQTEGTCFQFDPLRVTVPASHGLRLALAWQRSLLCRISTHQRSDQTH